MCPNSLLRNRLTQKSIWTIPCLFSAALAPLITLKNTVSRKKIFPVLSRKKFRKLCTLTTSLAKPWMETAGAVLIPVRTMIATRTRREATMITPAPKSYIATTTIRKIVLQRANALILVTSIISVAIRNVPVQVISPRNAARNVRKREKSQQNQEKSFWDELRKKKKLVNELYLFSRSQL